MSNTEISNLFVEGLGGEKNIQKVETDETVLRARVKDASLVSETLIQKCDAVQGIVTNKKDIQIILSEDAERIYKILPDSIKPHGLFGLLFS